MMNMPPKLNHNQNQNPLISYALKNYKSLSYYITAFLIILLSFLIYYRSYNPALNLINATPETLKETFFGTTPFVYYCTKEKNEDNTIIPPSILAAYQDVIKNGRSYGLAIVNCSQVLPSGHTIHERFHLIKSVKTILFVKAPWSSAIQAKSNHLKDPISLSKFISSSLFPRPFEINTDKEFQSKCGANSSTTDAKTCLVVMKGLRVSSSTNYLIEHLVESFPKATVISVDARTRRFPFENSQLIPENFAIKVYAVRSNHYLIMLKSPTWPNIEEFASNALQLPLHLYSGVGDGSEVKLIKPTVEVRQKKPKKRADGASSTQTENVHSGVSPSEDDKPTPSQTQAEEDVIKSAERQTEREKMRREEKRREEMRREEMEYLYDEPESTLGSDNNDGDEIANGDCIDDSCHADVIEL